MMRVLRLDLSTCSIKSCALQSDSVVRIDRTVVRIVNESLSSNITCFVYALVYTK